MPGGDCRCPAWHLGSGVAVRGLDVGSVSGSSRRGSDTGLCSVHRRLDTGLCFDCLSPDHSVAVSSLAAPSESRVVVLFR